MQTFIIEPEATKQRLDKYLTEQLAPLSRSQIKKLIENGQVLVNGEKPTVHHWLKPGESISVETEKEYTPAPLPEIEILAKTRHYLVINKPVGVLTHPADSHPEDPTVTDWLKKKFPKIKVGEEHRPGIVHRLDKLTSGVMIIARTEEMYEELKRQFHDREIKKTYLALTHDHLPELAAEIDKPIGRSQKGIRMAARAEKISEKDRDAFTLYKVLNRYTHHDYVEATPLTGRTHQIRVHLHSLGNPIVGDPLYRIHGQKDHDEFPRLFLHASTIRFKNLKGQEQTITAELPKELETILASLS